MAIHETVDESEAREDSTHRYELVPVFDPAACPFCERTGWERGSAWKPDPDQAGWERRQCLRGHTVRRRHK